MVNGVVRRTGMEDNFIKENKPRILKDLERMCETSGRIADFLLSSIKTYMQLIQDDNTSVDEARKYGGQIKESLDILKIYLPRHLEQLKKEKPQYAIIFSAS